MNGESGEWIPAFAEMTIGGERADRGFVF